MNVKVRMLHSMAGEGISLRPGELAEVPKATAEAWIEAGLAIEYDDSPERAVKMQPETAAGPKKRAAHKDDE